MPEMRHIVTAFKDNMRWTQTMVEGHILTIEEAHEMCRELERMKDFVRQRVKDWTPTEVTGGEHV